MLRLSYDLHIHSCLSPCAEDDMTPSNIVAMAALKGLDIIAISDHCSARNCPALFELAGQYGIIPIAAMEVSTHEEIHCLCLMPTLESALALDEIVYSRLPAIKDEKGIFGKQIIVDKDENITGNVAHLLWNATTIGFDELYSIVHSLGGILIPAHIDRKSASIISQLGFIPPDSDFTCVEVKDISRIPELASANPILKKMNIITNSDAHSLGDINEAINFINVKSGGIEDIFHAISRPNPAGNNKE